VAILARPATVQSRVPLWWATEAFGGMAVPVAQPYAGLDDRWPSVAFGDDGFAACQVRRVQINDDYGWRVRDAVVCPGSGISP
jgi:hypothetical protein